jgi:hypothetical protein
VVRWVFSAALLVACRTATPSAPSAPEAIHVHGALPSKAPSSATTRSTCTETATRGAESRSTSFELVRDGAGRVVELRTRSAGESPSSTTILRTYDERGQLAREFRRWRDESPDRSELARTEVETKQSWIRNAKGQIERIELSEEYVRGGARGQLTVTTVTATKRDQAGRPLRFDRVTTHRPDEGRIAGGEPRAGKVDREEPLIEREYDAAGRVVVEHSADVFERRPTTRRLTYVEGTSRVAIDERIMIDGDQKRGERIVTKYDARGRPIRVEELHAAFDGSFNGEPERVTESGYDEAGRLVFRSIGNVRVTYRWDGDCGADLPELLAEPSVVWTEP